MLRVLLGAYLLLNSVPASVKAVVAVMLHALMLLAVTLQVVMLLSVRLIDVMVPTTVRLEKLPLQPVMVVAVTDVPMRVPVNVPPVSDS